MIDLSSLLSGVSNFTTIFLGIFIEAAPFLLLGTVTSGLVEVFVSREELLRLLPRGVVPATVVGALMGFTFPVGECGVVPLTRRLFKKGVPVPAGIAFLLAGPILNPVALASTFAAYGFGTVLLARFGMGLLVALGVGLVFALNTRPMWMLQPQALAPVVGGSGEAAALPVRKRLREAMRIARGEFFEMGRYLILGSLLAALVQTVVPRSTLLALGSGPVGSVVEMQVLGYVLAVGSTVDAFVSLGFASTFTTGAILGFLVYGPMADIKSTLMLLGVFRRKYVAYLVILPFLATMLLAVFANLNLRWQG